MNMFALVTPGPTEWVLILVIVLVLFGAKKLPELARSLGQSMNEFRKAREEFDKELHRAGEDLKGTPQTPQTPQNTQPVQPSQQVPQAQPPTQPPTQPSKNSLKIKASRG